LKILSEKITNGPPFSDTIFEEAFKEVFDLLNSGDLQTRLANFGTAAIYKYFDSCCSIARDIEKILFWLN